MNERSQVELVDFLYRTSHELSAIIRASEALGADLSGELAKVAEGMAYLLGGVNQRVSQQIAFIETGGHSDDH